MTEYSKSLAVKSGEAAFNLALELSNGRDPLFRAAEYLAQYLSQKDPTLGHYKGILNNTAEVLRLCAGMV